ncbi:MAG: beta-propeller fold lactonase family protein [Sphingobium sp.]
MRFCGRRCATLLALAMAPFMASAGSARELVYVQASKSEEVVVIDANTFEPVTRIPIGGYTDDVVGLPDGTMAFTNVMLSNNSPLGSTVGEGGLVHGIDTATNKLVWETFVDGLPNHMAVNSNGRELYVTLADRSWIVVLDTRTGRILKRLFSVMGNHGAKMTPDGKHLVVGNMFIDAMLVYDAASGDVVRTINTREGVRPFQFDKRGKVYYQLSRFHGFEVRDLATGALEKVVELPKLPASVPAPEAYPHTVDHGLAITPDGSAIVAAASTGNYVAVYSLPDLKLRGTVPVGEDPNWIAVRADSKVAFVSNRKSNSISVVDLDGLKEIRKVPAGTLPQRLSVIDVPESM